MRGAISRTAISAHLGILAPISKNLLNYFRSIPHPICAAGVGDSKYSGMLKIACNPAALERKPTLRPERFWNDLQCASSTLIFLNFRYLYSARFLKIFPIISPAFLTWSSQLILNFPTVQECSKSLVIFWSYSGKLTVPQNSDILEIFKYTMQ